MRIQTAEEFAKVNSFGLGQANTRICEVLHRGFVFEPPDRAGGERRGPGQRHLCARLPQQLHVHHAKRGGGQILICTAGSGWYQEAGKAAVSLEPGTVIVIPPEVKHWHGAKKDSWFSHIAFEIPGENCGNEWCEPVTDEQYNALEG